MILTVFCKICYSSVSYRGIQSEVTHYMSFISQEGSGLKIDLWMNEAYNATIHSWCYWINFWISSSIHCLLILLHLFFWLSYKIFRLFSFLQPSGLEVVVGKITAAQDLLCSQFVYDLEQCLPSSSSSQTISFKLISWAIIHFSSRMSTLLTNI